MKIIPVGKWMLIEKQEKKGLVELLPGTDVSKDVSIGTVISVGDEVELYKKGDKFIYEKHVLTKFTHDKIEHFLTLEKYPLAKIE